MPDKLRSDPSYRHPLFQPDKRHLPPPPTAAQSTPRAAPTTFDHILPSQAANHYRSTTPTSSKDASLTRLAPQASTPQQHDSHQPQSRTKSVFARFRPWRSGQAESDQPRGPDRQARRQLRQTSRERSKQLKAEQKEMEKQERARNLWLGGMAWGFDPGAGQSPRSSTEVRTTCSSKSETGSSHRGTSTQRSFEGSARRTHHTTDMGLESGGPGRAGNFDYGILKSARR